jgi:hypothetical protein
MPPSFHQRIETKDIFSENNNGHKSGVLHATQGIAALDAPKPPPWPTKASLQWFQCVRNQWQNSPRTPVQAILPFFDFVDDAIAHDKSETIPHDNRNNEKTLHLNGTELKNLEESLLEEDEMESGRRIEFFQLDDVNPESRPDEHHGTLTEHIINDSYGLLDSSSDAALNVTTSTGSSLQEQIEWLHHSIDQSKERLIHTKTQLEQHIELLKSRQSRNRGGPPILSCDDASTTQTLEVTSSPRACDGTIVLQDKGTEKANL